MRLRYGLLWLAAVILAVSLTACGDDDDDNNGVPPGDAGDVIEDVGDAGDVSDVGDVTPDAPDVTDAGDVADTADGDDDAADGDDDTGDIVEGPTPNPGAATQIADVAAGTDGTISGAAVTYTRASFGSDAAGFFVQATQAGPAVFVSVDPTTTTPEINVGDIITFDASGIETNNGIPTVTAIDNLSVDGTGYDVTNLTQDVTATADLVSAVDDYTSELVQADVDITGSFSFAGSGHVSAAVDTTAITGSENLELRIPEVLQDRLGLNSECTLTVGPTPLWRFADTVQLSIWDVEDVSSVTCDATGLESAVAISDTEVQLTFERDIDASSITDVSTQFTITPSLAVSGFAVDGNTITLTTDAQNGGTEYTVEVADTVTDIFGAGVDATENTAVFFGFVPPAEVVINEVNANVTGGCDMVELRVTSGGSLDGVQLWERTGSVASFSAGFNVATNDIVVIHFDQNDTSCNSNGAVSEDAAIDQQPEANFPENFDNAWDWWTQDGGITATNNVLTLYDATGNIIDAVFLVNETACTGYDTAGGTEDQADVVGDAGEWVPMTGTPPAGDVWANEEFCNAAVPGLGSTSSNANGTTIQRIDDTDDNNRADWTASPAASSWAEINSGQTAF